MIMQKVKIQSYIFQVKRCAAHYLRIGSKITGMRYWLPFFFLRLNRFSLFFPFCTKLYWIYYIRNASLDDKWQVKGKTQPTPRNMSLMCAYKLCRVEFRYWGMQTKLEKFIHDTALRKTMVNANSNLILWFSSGRMDSLVVNACLKRPFKKKTGQSTSTSMGMARWMVWFIYGRYTRIWTWNAIIVAKKNGLGWWRRRWRR